MQSIRFRLVSSIRIMSRREASASARKAWSSAGRRGLRFGVGAGVCLGCAASCGVGRIWAPWGVLGEGEARGGRRRSVGLGRLVYCIYRAMGQRGANVDWAAGVGEGWVRAWGEGVGGVAIDIYMDMGRRRGRLAYGWASA